MPIKFAGYPCLDPKSLHDACGYAFIPTAHWDGKANRFETRAGRKPGTGAFLLSRSDLLQLGPPTLPDKDISLTADYDAVFTSDVPGGKTITLKKLVVTGVKCIVPAATNEGQRPYLVEVADVRWLLEMLPVEKAYNLRKADGTGYATATLNAGVPWTWAQVVQDLWTACGLTGTATLPFTPNGTPENLSYYGWSAWGALCDVLDRIACVADFDPENYLFTVKRIGSNVPELFELAKLEALNRSWDSTPVDPRRAHRPEKVRVRFVRYPAPTGGENPYYLVDVALFAYPGVYVGTVVRVWDDMSALGATGAPSNAAALATRANERAADWQRKFEFRDRPKAIVYEDVQPGALKPVGCYATGAAVTDTGGGLRTEFVSGPDDILENWRSGIRKVADAPGGGGSGTPLTVENLDLSLSVPNVATIDLNQDQGLKIAATVATQVTITVADCSDSLTGVVHAYLGALASTNNQYLGRGNKSIKAGALYVDNAGAAVAGWGIGTTNPIYAAGALPNATTALIASAEYSTSTDGFGTSGHAHILRAGSDQSNQVLFSTKCNVTYNRSPSTGVGTSQLNYILLDVEGAVTLQPCYAVANLGQNYYGGWFTAAGILFAGGLAIRPTAPVVPVTPPPPPPPAGKSSIRVIVSDPKGNPVVGRNVTQAATPGSSANTDANGYVDFGTLDVGSAQAVTVTLAGTEAAFGVANWSGAGNATATTNVVNVDTVADLVTTVRFTLTPDLLTAFSLDPVAGTGSITVDGVTLNSTTVIAVATAFIANATLADADGFYRATTTVGALTIKLPATPTPGRRITLKDSAGAAATNTLTLDGNGKNIDGAATLAMTNDYQSVSVFYDGTQWLIY